jgi:hypothetical protein
MLEAEVVSGCILLYPVKWLRAKEAAMLVPEKDKFYVAFCCGIKECPKKRSGTFLASNRNIWNKR